MTHQWVALIVYNLTDDLARKLVEAPAGPPVPVLFPEHPVDEDERGFLSFDLIDQDQSSVGCFRCERPWSRKLAQEPCPGEPRAYSMQGEPLFDDVGIQEQKSA